ncbi:uncharacterized protein LOC122384212 [Amphibalanus amphitrite]|uniref:uncharacterized protein LOC122384212 n=1 Tax=Amphibalanus amphitrite TaxID=1232801 RepID=UPI001C91F5D1|nr:uncharacterized protein LOC122384212 [Amphibalanus amphitrite]
MCSPVAMARTLAIVQAFFAWPMAVGQRVSPVEWLSVTLDGPCRSPGPPPVSVERGVLGVVPPGPRVTNVTCDDSGRQLTANITLTVHQTLQLTHVLDRLRAFNSALFIEDDAFQVCCYRRRPYRLRERAVVWRPRARVQLVVYAAVAGTCVFLAVGAALLAVAHAASRPRRPSPVAPPTVRYSEEMVRRRLDRQHSEHEEDVLLDALSQPPLPRDEEPAVANRRSADFY